MPTHKYGGHENGQNFLVEHSVIADIVGRVERTTGHIVEIGAGHGALTIPLSRLGRPVIAVEVDPAASAFLASRVGENVSIVRDDFLRYELPQHPHVLVGNLPFHLTTALLRRILHADGWSHAVLLVQWEVARRRAGVGGASMMTAQWAPWFAFSLGQRVGRSAFEPRPNVDGGLLEVTRRERPLVGWAARAAFQSMVHRVFTGPGRGLSQILVRNRVVAGQREAQQFLERHGRPADALPKDLGVEEWVDLFARRPSRPSRSRSESRGRGSRR